MIYINGSPLNVTLFPDNTSQVWHVPQLKLPETNFIHVVWEYLHEGEFLHIAQLKTLSDSLGFKVSLQIKYLPYARQDKTVSNDTTFALHTFATLLNSLKFQEIIIHDPHSSVALDLIENSRAAYPMKELIKVIDEVKPDCLCYPDKGAVTKYAEMPIYKMYRYIYGEKVRDQATGRITDYKVMLDKSMGKIGLFDKSVLIVDDICDGGATFIILAEKLLKDIKVKEVNLFVTHGIFSKGLFPLFEAGIKHVFTQEGEASPIEFNKVAYRRL